MTIASRAGEQASQAPRIAPVPAGVKRPLWSVMIPTFNCARYLGRTLQSALEQDPGPERMQIEVVDDASTKDDPEAVVREIGRGRVRFYRKPKNAGATANFNTCIERSTGRLVHILHGDDWVGPEFYARFGAAFEESPRCAAVFSRAFIVDEQGKSLGLSLPVGSLSRESNDARELMLDNPLRAPAAVVRRRFYEEQGGFEPSLVHVADWEMWVRAVTRGRARMLDRALASYRLFAANDTGRLVQSADNYRDYLRLAEIWERAGLPGFDRVAFERMVIRKAVEQWRQFRILKNPEAAGAYSAFLRDSFSTQWRLGILLRMGRAALRGQTP
jgi:glycosyltransferase involved in cell wall biosynthesis